MRRMYHVQWTAALLVAFCAASSAQQAASTTSPEPNPDLERRVQALSQALASAQQRLEDSQREIVRMQQALANLQRQMASTASPATPLTASTPPATPSQSSSIAKLEDREQAVEAAVRTHDQTKVESASKYPLRVTGLVLFNGFLNRGVGDNLDLPEVALRPSATSASGSLGASFRQTVLGLQGFGPNVAGARTSASVNFDFFSDESYSNYGTSAGTVRMRTADITMTWPQDVLQFGMSAPLISPLSPDSFATVAEPSLAGAGNLWTWAPQLRYAHQFSDPTSAHVQLEFGLWDSAAAGYNSNQLFRTASPAENSELPALETRLSYNNPHGNGLQVGLSGYYSRQSYPHYAGYSGTEHLDSWATAIDWRVPLTPHFELSGEGYRGRSLGGLGGGVYKDAIAGIDPVTGLPDLHGLNAVGGWAQWKTRFSQVLEWDVSMGLDDGFARDFRAVIQSPSASVTQLRARNRMAVANVIYRPRTYLIFSPEYRRIWSSQINGSTSTMNIFTLSVGYQF